MAILVTGGSGFIGSNFILDWLDKTDESVVNLDALTYAGNPENLVSLAGDSSFERCFLRSKIESSVDLTNFFILAQHNDRVYV